MSDIPKISEAEWQVLKVIWDSPKITASLIIESLKDREEWKSSTVKTLINRLLTKNAIGYEKLGKEYLYYALIEEDECVIKESESFLDRVFNGSINSMVLGFVKSQKLSKDEITELRNILDESSCDE
ncbi:BlaI/MecI/CopY family transcriptional regulator [uncultured Clostridium sp.]|uniref:BlaI/MecI/CopY family transcriptional regulator n=1 Tax=uncultured Clostridium sp. TaxID=59620 RepID=UPI0026356573|nr:BlaI/MecI/CopY family transcriptional regulator [uncultured Clostridium sp.]